MVSEELSSAAQLSYFFQNLQLWLGGPGSEFGWVAQTENFAGCWLTGCTQFGGFFEH